MSEFYKTKLVWNGIVLKSGELWNGFQMSIKIL